MSAACVFCFARRPKLIAFFCRVALLRLVKICGRVAALRHKNCFIRQRNGGRAASGGRFGGFGFFGFCLFGFLWRAFWRAVLCGKARRAARQGNGGSAACGGRAASFGGRRVSAAICGRRVTF